MGESLVGNLRSHKPCGLPKKKKKKEIELKNKGGYAYGVAACMGNFCMVPSSLL